MKQVLCFGDSNTFGFIPESGKRYDKNTRWSGILAQLATGRFEIIEAGCNNRTAFSDNPAGFEQTGCKVLPTLLTKNLDCVILAIGVNDLQIFYNPSFEEIKNGMRRLVDIVREHCPKAEIILVSPARLTDNIFNGYFRAMFDKMSIEKSLHLSEIYESIAKEKNCRFTDWDKIVTVSPKDGLHLEPDAHKKIAEAMFEILYQIF